MNKLSQFVRYVGSVCQRLWSFLTGTPPPRTRISSTRNNTSSGRSVTPTRTNTTPQPKTKKTFIIVQQPPKPVRGGGRGNRNFQAKSKTKPQICPECQTHESSCPGNIVLVGSKWKCRECGDEWNK
jgi:hypothetical protein